MLLTYMAFLLLLLFLVEFIFFLLSSAIIFSNCLMRHSREVTSLQTPLSLTLINCCDKVEYSMGGNQKPECSVYNQNTMEHLSKIQ